MGDGSVTVSPSLLPQGERSYVCPGRHVLFDRAGKIIEGDALPLEKIASHRIPLRDVHEGIDLLRQGKAIKSIMHPEE
jgi:threonine dehydrogenase-like Zn-dependent dehydrogenase